MKRSKFLVVACCIVILGLWGNAIPADPIKVGMALPMTGPGSMMGRDMRDGATLAADKFNASGGLNGQKIEIIVMDEKNQPTTALNVAKKLIYQDKVFCLGTNYSPPSIAVIPLTKETETPHFISGVAQKILEMDNPWIFRSTPSDKVLAGQYVNFAMKNLNLKKLAILNESTDYGKGGRNDLIDKMKEYNTQPLIVESYNLGDKDFAAQLNKIKNAGPDGLFIWGLYVEGAQIMRQAKQLGLNMPILASSGVLQGAFFELAGKDAEGMYLETYFFAKNSAPQVQAFVKEYTEKFKYEPQPGAGIAYDAMTMLINGLKKVGAPDKYKVMKEIRASRFNGVIGRQECDNVGQCGRSAIILQVKNGAPGVVWSSD